MKKVVIFLSLTVFAWGIDPSEAVFTEIYEKKVWGTNEQGEGYSGSGSRLDATEVYRVFLQQFFQKYQIKNIVDLGCGDWEFSRALNFTGIDYLGIDVVKHVIEKNQKKYEAPNVHFFHANGVEIDLPSADLLICKDVMQHQNIHQIQAILSQLGKYKYCLLVNDVETDTLSSRNHMVSTGGYRTLDLTRRPFNVKGIKVLTYSNFPALNSKQVLLITN